MRHFIANILCFLLAAFPLTARAQLLVDNLLNLAYPYQSDTYFDFNNIKGNASSAEYSGRITWSNGILGLRSDNSGLFTAKSGGKVSKLTMQRSYSSGGTLNVYGSNEPFTSLSDVAVKGKLVASLSDADKEFVFTESFLYVAFIVPQGSKVVAFKTFDITWQVGTLNDPNLSFPTKSYSAIQGFAFQSPVLTNPFNRPVTFTSSNTTVATVSAQGLVTLTGPGTTQITATAEADEQFYAATAQYELQVANAYYSYRRISAQSDIKEGATYLLVTERPDNIEKQYEAFNGIVADNVAKMVDISSNVLNNSYVGPANATGTPYVVVLEAKGNNFLIKSNGEAIGLVKGNETNLGLKGPGDEWSITYNTDDHTVSIISPSYPDREWRYSPRKTIPGLSNLKIAYNSVASYPRPTLYIRENPTLNIASEEGYATFYISRPYVMPEGLQGAAVVAYEPVENESTYSLKLDYRYPSGSVVPALMPLVLKGQKGTYEYQFYETSESVATDSYLEGTLSGEVQDDGQSYYYALMYNKEGRDIGFYRGNAEGSPFKIKENQAFLKLPKAMKVESFSFENNTTGISRPETCVEATPSAVYTLQGTRCTQPFTELPRGIYIVNGRKVMK